MIPRTKQGDCSDPVCGAKNTAVVKVGKELFCIKCRQKQKANKQISQSQKKAFSRKIYKVANTIQNSEEKERAYLIMDLDDVVSKYVRIKNANAEGIITCFTCAKTGDWTTFDCGHYISRSFMKLRWDLRNLNPQCVSCNRHLDGNLDAYAEAINSVNPGLVETLIEESRAPHKWTRQDLKEMLIDYRHKLNMAKLKFK